MGFLVSLGAFRRPDAWDPGACEAFGATIGFQTPERGAATFVEGIQGTRNGGRGVCGMDDGNLERPRRPPGGFKPPRMIPEAIDGAILGGVRRGREIRWGWIGWLG